MSLMTMDMTFHYGRLYAYISCNLFPYEICLHFHPAHMTVHALLVTSVALILK